MIYEISCGSSLAKVSTTGGELISYHNNGMEYIWRDDKAYWSGHAPVLFPTVGALKNKKTTINGKKYSIMKHGFAGKSEFTLIELNEDSAVFSLKSDENTKKSYPFEFELQIIHTVLLNGFKTEYKVINDSNEEMLFGIGGRIGFNCPLIPDRKFNEYSIQFERIEDGPYYYTRISDSGGIIHREDRVPELEGWIELKLDYLLFDRDVLVIDNLKSKSCMLLENVNNKGVELKMQGFNSMGIWTSPKKRAPFLCIEPWTVTPDFADHSGSFEEKPNITRLSPGNHFHASYEMVII